MIEAVQAVADEVVGAGYPAWKITDKLHAILSPVQPTKKKEAQQTQAESPAPEPPATTPLDKAWRAAKRAMIAVKARTNERFGFVP